MEDYIIEISKYYFKGVLDNEVIQKKKKSFLFRKKL